MTHFAVLGTGPSMSATLASRVAHLRCVAVNDAYRLVKQPEAIVAQDLAWWNANPAAMKMQVPRYSTSYFIGVNRISHGSIYSGTNSGLVGLHVAIARGARCVLLLGIDLAGSHYFGPHEKLKNTSEARFAEFRRQFSGYARTIPAEVEVWNCSPHSTLDCFPFADLDKFLADKDECDARQYDYAAVRA